jgi:hypothetical protein
VTDEEAEEKFVIDVDGNYKDFCSNFGISGMIQRPDFVIFGVIGNPDEYSVLVDDLRRQLTQNGSRAYPCRVESGGFPKVGG